MIVRRKKKHPLEIIIIVGLTLAFASIWLWGHWNLSRQPPHHKGPGSVGYQDANATTNE